METTLQLYEQMHGVPVPDYEPALRDLVAFAGELRRLMAPPLRSHQSSRRRHLSSRSRRAGLKPRRRRAWPSRGICRVEMRNEKDERRRRRAAGGKSREFFSSSIVGMIHGSRLAADAKEDASGSPQAQAR